MHQDCVYYSTMRLQPQPLCAEIPSDAEKYRAIQLKKPAFLPLKSPCASSRRLSAHALNRPARHSTRFWQSAPPSAGDPAGSQAARLGQRASRPLTTGTTGVSPVDTHHWVLLLSPTPHLARSVENVTISTPAPHAVHSTRFWQSAPPSAGDRPLGFTIARNPFRRNIRL